MNLKKGTVVRHVKNGGLCIVEYLGYFQCTYEPLDEEEVVVYATPDGVVEVRLREEFEDGRFEEVSQP